MIVKDGDVLRIARFPLGGLYATPGILAGVPGEEIATALDRHALGDWGDVDADDRKANDRALISGARLVSTYRSKGGVKILIITEADRSSTTVLLPEEY